MFPSRLPPRQLHFLERVVILTCYHHPPAALVLLLTNLPTGYILNLTPACFILLGSGNAGRRDRGINPAHHPLYNAERPLRAQKHRRSSPIRAMCCDGDILGTL